MIRKFLIIIRFGCVLLEIIESFINFIECWIKIATFKQPQLT